MALPTHWKQGLWIRCLIKQLCNIIINLYRLILEQNPECHRYARYVSDFQSCRSKYQSRNCSYPGEHLFPGALADNRIVIKGRDPIYKGPLQLNI